MTHVPILISCFAFPRVRLNIHEKIRIKVTGLSLMLLFFSSCAGSFDDVNSPIVNAKLENGAAVRCKWAANHAGQIDFRICDDGKEYLNQKNIMIMRVE